MGCMATMHSGCSHGVLCLLVFVFAIGAKGDATAAATMQEMLSLIDAGKFDNNFFDGDVLTASPTSDAEMVAGCLTDKIVAIVREDGIENFANDLQVDLAAC